MKKTLRKKFVIFAMSAVTIFLAVLVGAINGFNWMILERQSNRILYTQTTGAGVFSPVEPFIPSLLAPKMSMDTLVQGSLFVRVLAVSIILDLSAGFWFCCL